MLFKKYLCIVKNVYYKLIIKDVLHDIIYINVIYITNNKITYINNIVNMFFPQIL